MFHRLPFKPNRHSLVPRGCGLKLMQRGMIPIWFRITMFLFLSIFSCFKGLIFLQFQKYVFSCFFHIPYMFFSCFYHVSPFLYNKFLQFFLSCFQYFDVLYPVKHDLQCFNKFFTMLLPCFKGFKTCLFNYFFIFQGYVLNDFSNQ